ncbi:hypothetical protein COW46_02785 [Candidatus Gracilibacteria bacterium CG17_big_fil_post_rev_8_21_14_2_50_48_13]|nr:MAG: hypothetical protein COW46_02785 [Candidatus Gracilibacteria bacterium CG17_big_fil_post_rev_8_21_14_2_50_48_13]
MKNFLVLYAATEETFAHWSSMSEADAKAGMNDWMEWQKNNAAALVQPGAPVGKNLRLTASGASQTANEICGYCVMRADTAEDVTKILASNPHLATPGTYVEIMPVMEM